MMKSKKLQHALISGKVVVKNITAGEVMIKIPLREGGLRTLCIPAFGEVELAPKYTDAMLLQRSPNLAHLLYRTQIRVQ
jgi:hypothetical protein